MANYIIIGGDGKEYGPVSDADVRQWIAEGRLSAESRVKAESDAEFRALAQFPEFADALRLQPTPGTIPPAATSADFMDRDYELDISGCITRGWELYKGNFGIIFGSFIIMLLALMACGGALNMITGLIARGILHAPIVVQVGYNYLVSGLIALVSGPLMGGLYLVYLKTIRKQTTGIGELFAGFQQSYGQLVLGALVVSLVVGVCMMPFQFVWQAKAAPMLVQMQTMQNDPAGVQKLLPQLMAAGTSSLPLLIVCLIPVTFLTVCWQFTLPLIIDKQMTFGTAMKTSWTMVMKHWWQLFGLFIVAGLVSILGAFGCCIGIIFTLPIAPAAVMIAYETIFGAKRN
jgi:uncharacterized membrane protein